MLLGGVNPVRTVSSLLSVFFCTLQHVCCALSPSKATRMRQPSAHSSEVKDATSRLHAHLHVHSYPKQTLFVCLFVCLLLLWWSTYVHFIFSVSKIQVESLQKRQGARIAFGILRSARRNALARAVDAWRSAAARRAQNALRVHSLVLCTVRRQRVFFLGKAWSRIVWAAGEREAARERQVCVCCGGRKYSKTDDFDLGIAFV